MKYTRRLILIGAIICSLGLFYTTFAQVELFNDYSLGNPNCTTGNCTTSSSGSTGTGSSGTTGSATVPPRTTNTGTGSSSNTGSGAVNCSALGPDDTIPPECYNINPSDSGGGNTTVYCEDYDVPPFDCVPRPQSSSGSSAPISCTTIATDAQYNKCCTGMGPYPEACTVYTQSCINGVCTAPAGSIGGGTPGTNAVNGPASQWNFTYDGAGAPQSGSSQLAQCSAIRFLSLLDVLIWVKCIIVIGVIPLIFTLAFVFFLWGVLRFVYASDIKQKEESKKLIWYGLLGLFVMVSVWGIIKILGDTVGLDTGAVPLLQTSALDINKATKK